MSVHHIIKEDYPKLPLGCPFKSPLADKFYPGDELVIVARWKPQSSIFIKLTSGEAEKKVVQLYVSLSLTSDNKLICTWDRHNYWEDVQLGDRRTFEQGTICIKVLVNMNKFLLLVDGICPETFTHNYPPFTPDTLEIGVSQGTAFLELVSLTRPIQWLESKIGSPTPAIAFKCGKDEHNNDVYMGRVFKNFDSVMIVSVIPALGEATTVFNGRVKCPIDSYELLQHSNYYGWKAIGHDKKIPEEAVLVGYDDHGERVCIGRATIEGSVIPGTLHVKGAILSIPFNGKEVKISSGYEVLVVLSPLEVKKEPPRAPVKVKPPQNKQDCVICYAQEITTAFNPCGHLGFCESCAQELVRRNNKCPICNRHIESYLRTYKVV